MRRGWGYFDWSEGDLGLDLLGAQVGPILSGESLDHMMLNLL